MNQYTGYIEVQLADDALAKLYSNHNSDFKQELCRNLNLKENQYLIVKDWCENISNLFCYQNGTLRPVSYKTFSNMYVKEVKPRNVHQQLAIDLLNDRNVPVKVLRGVYGSGKDYLMWHKALQLVNDGEFRKIIYIRPNVTLAGVPDIGHLKGDLTDKLGWTLGPLFDKVGGEEGVQTLICNDELEMMPLLFIRGRSFDNSIIYVSEGQNINSEVAKVIISRIGEGSELWINADTHQTDNKIYDKDNGILKMLDRLSGQQLFGAIYLPKTERSAVAELATLLDD